MFSGMNSKKSSSEEMSHEPNGDCICASCSIKTTNDVIIWAFIINPSHDADK